MLYLTPFSHNTSVTDGQMTTTTKGEPLRLELSDRPDNAIFMVGSTIVDVKMIANIRSQPCLVRLSPLPKNQPWTHFLRCSSVS